jgi:hypothetical protein
VRLQQRIDATGRWTLEVSDCARGADGRAIRVYETEHDARLAWDCVQKLGVLLGPLVDRYDGTEEHRRWQTKHYDLSASHVQQLARLAGSVDATVA